MGSSLELWSENEVFHSLSALADLSGLILLGSANWFDIANQLNQLPLEKQGE